ncbi:MAG: hypothetical protein YK1312THETA_1680005 [Marine Group I thaumarchaeote]|nr:MAG: hypothetical protein YK1312THETA_1680005 [Marine Group I thaumarchaeote]
MLFKRFDKAFIYKIVIASILEHKNHSTGFRIFRISNRFRCYLFQARFCKI